MKFGWFTAVGLMLLPVVVRGEAPPVPDRVAADQVIDVDHFESDLLARVIFRATNELRAREGLPPLKAQPQLAAAAADQAAMLSIRIHSGHDNPLANHGDPHARALQAGLPEGAVGENAATLTARDRENGRNHTYREMAAVIVQAWLDSPGHRANLLDPKWHYLGCGTRSAWLLGNPTVYAIQDFYTPAPRRDPPSDMPGGGHLTR